MKKNWKFSALFSALSIVVCLISAYAYSMGLAYFLAIPCAIFSYFWSFYLSKKFNFETEIKESWKGVLFGVSVVALTLISVGCFFALPLFISDSISLKSIFYAPIGFLFMGTLLTLGIPYILCAALGAYWARKLP